MEKEFFSVFPTLKVGKNLQELFGGTKVVRITFNRENTKLKIYLESDHLIHKKYIYEMEKALTACVCQGTCADVVISERFVLSSQYTPETLIDEYRDSLSTEMWHISPIYGNFFKGAKLEYPDEETVVLQLEDTQICMDVGGKIRDLLQQILNERCGMGCSVETQYVLEPKRRARAVYDEDFPQPSVTVPVEQEQEEKHAPAPEKKAYAGGRNAGRGNGRKSKWGDRKDFGGFIRSSNPDVICGKDVEGDLIPISDIVGEIGLVTIRGKIQSNERRDIRNNKSILKFVITDFTDSIAVKIFAPTEEADKAMERLAPGRFVKVQGYTKMDTFEHEITITSPSGVMAIPSFVKVRQDHYEKKRVELHLHTKMSDMDGVS
ncbi:MAG: PolC-type DNA polymerase III N-terminal domain-containing protein, partial [Lachnospiraceae bacterium]